MAEPSRSRQALLEFAELCRQVAQERSGRSDLEINEGDASVFHPCPMPRHEYRKGTRPPAWSTMISGGIVTKCHRCTEDDGRDPAEFTEAVKAEVGWEEDGVKRPRFADETLRWHDFVSCDGAHVVRHTKKRPAKGGAPDYWLTSLRKNSDSVFDQGFRTFKKGEFQEWVADHYGWAKTHFATRWYREELFDGVDLCQVVLTEGEKDADTFNRVARAGGGAAIATTLISPGPSALAPHHHAVLAERDVVVMMDNGAAGVEHAKRWTAAAWGKCREVRVFPSEEFGEVVVERGRGKGSKKPADFTEWVDRLRATMTDAEVYRAWQELASQQAPLDAPLMKPGEWKNKLRKTKEGKASSTNIYNGATVWMEHPDLAGRVRTNSATGEVEIVDPPWGDDCAGARQIAAACAVWLDAEHGVAIGEKTLEAAFAYPRCAPPHNPHADLLAEEWDGESRLNHLFTKYLPLNAAPHQAVDLARVFVGDLVMRLLGEQVEQRVVVAAGTKHVLNLARALVGDAGMMHAGRMDPATFARRGAAVVQLDMDAVAHRTIAPSNVAHLLATYVPHRSGRRLPPPIYVAAGAPPTGRKAIDDVHERVLLLKVVGPTRIDELALDAPQILAEGRARLTELRAASPPHKEDLETIDEVRRRASNYAMIRALVLYATKPLTLGVPAQPGSLQLPDRAEPVLHIYRDQFFDTMEEVLHKEWRTRAEWITAWGQVIKDFRLPNQVGITPAIEAALGIDVLNGEQRATKNGTYLGKGRLQTLKSWMEDPDVDDGETSSDEGEKGGGEGVEPEFEKFEEVSTSVLTRKPAGLSGLNEAFVPIKKGSESRIESTPIARVTRMESEEGSPRNSELENLADKTLTAIELGGRWSAALDGEPVDDLRALVEAIDDAAVLGDPLPRLGDGAREWLASVGIEL